jgi:hypothetical protein
MIKGKIIRIRNNFAPNDFAVDLLTLFPSLPSVNNSASAIDHWVGVGKMRTYR